MDAKAYRGLNAWRRAMEMVEAIYEVTEMLPDTEKFGLTSQLRRAAVSVPANIAEGYGRSHRGDYLHHLSIARGSAMEVETHLILTVRLGMIHRDEAMKAWNLCQETGRLLTRLIEGLHNNPKPTAPD